MQTSLISLQVELGEINILPFYTKSERVTKPINIYSKYLKNNFIFMPYLVPPRYERLLGPSIIWS